MVQPAPVFKVERKGDTLIVSPLGHSLQFASGEVESQTNKLLEKMDELGTQNVIFDLHKVNLLDSVVIGTLFAVTARVRKSNGRVLMCNVSPRMQETLVVVSFNDLVTECDTRDDALEELGA